MDESRSTEFPRAAVLRRRAEITPVWVPVSGESMGRTIRPGARVLVASTRKPPKRGEIWAFEADGRMLVHRFRSAHDGRYWLRGDANRRDDRSVPVEALIGRVVEIDGESGCRMVGRRDRWRGRLRLDADSVRRWLLAIGRRLGRRRFGGDRGASDVSTS